MKKYAYMLFVIIMVICTTNFAQAASSVENGHLYYIKNVRSGKYLTADSNKNIYQGSLANNENQRFYMNSETINKVKYYSIVSDMDSNYRLDIDNAVDANFQNVKLFTQNSSYPSAQRFKLLKLSNYRYQIMPQLSSTRVLDVENASTASGANVQLYTKRSSNDSLVNAQLWEFEPATTSLLSWRLVRDKHLDWYAKNSSYADKIEDAAAVWNSYKSKVIRKDNLLRTREVTIVDATNLGGAVGVTNVNGTISLNTKIMKNYTDSQIKNVIVHELGHALGMGHIDDTANVLYYTVNSTTTLKASNKKSYDLAYAKY